MNARTLVVALTALSVAGCSEMVRPRSAGEHLTDRPDRALVIGEFKIMTEGVPDAEVGMTPHQMYAGKDRHGFRGEIPDDGRVFALWVVPGVFCFGQPTHGTPPKVLGGKAPCAEIPEKGKAYYVGTVIWRVKKEGSEVKAELQVDDRRESVSASQFFVGIYMDPAIVSTELSKPEEVAAKFKP